MANDFKRFAKPNVGTSTGASGDAVYTVPAGSGSSALESIIIGISICNKNSAERTVGMLVLTGSTWEVACPIPAYVASLSSDATDTAEPPALVVLTS